MAPKTRSSVPSSSARRQTPASTPASRVYRHADPPLQQTRFPPPKKTLKTYGRRTTCLSASAALRQQTMTQIGYVVPTQPDELDDNDDDDDDDDDENETEDGRNDDHDEKGKRPEKQPRDEDVEKPRALRGSTRASKTPTAKETKQSRPSKRRKTMGDAPSSSFVTQTLTQMLPQSTEKEMVPIIIGDSEDDQDEDEGGAIDTIGRGGVDQQHRGEQLSRASSIVPQTPTHDRNPTSAAIPLSPAVLSPSVRMLIRNSSPLGVRRSPLKVKSTNASALQPRSVQRRTAAAATATSSEKRKRRPTPRDAVIPDSYSTAGELSSPAAPSAGGVADVTGAADTVSSSLLGTPTRRTRIERSPLGELSLTDLPRTLPPPRRRVAQSVGSSPLAPDENTTPLRPVVAAQTEAGPSTDGILHRGARPADAEIPDSDDELDSLNPTPNRSTPTPLRVAFADMDESEEASDSGLAPETPTRPPPRRPTPATRSGGADEALEEPGSPTPVARNLVSGTAPGDAGPTMEADSEAEAEGSIPETPTGRPSQRTQALKETAGPVTKTTRTGTSIPLDAEIGDSDVEADSPSPTPKRIRPITPTATTPTPAARSASRNTRLAKEKLPSPPPPRAVLGSSSPARDIAGGGASSALPSVRSGQTEHPAEIPTSDHGGDDGEDTPLTSPGFVVRTSPARPPSRRSPRKANQARIRGHTQKHTQYETQGAYTQLMESQRVPMEVLREMAPASERSDVVVTMHPSRVQEVVEGMRNHEFRATRLPRSVVRTWIYVGRPAQELRYMATLGPPRTIGQIDPNTGLGNAEFNEGKRMAGGVAKFAYELVQVYELSNPVSLDRMRESGWTEGQDERSHKFLPPAVVGQLLANLRCALFDDGEQHLLEGDDGDGDGDGEGFGRDGGCSGPPPGTAATSASGSVSQQVEAQIHSDMEHSTQFASRAGYAGDEVIPSSQQASPVTSRTPAKRGMRRGPNTEDEFVAPLPPQSAGRRMSQRLREQQQQQQQGPKTPAAPRSGRKSVSFSQATTASQGSTQAMLPPSSPVQRLPSPSRAPSSRKKKTPTAAPQPILISSSSGRGNSLMTRRHHDDDEDAGDVDLSVRESYNMDGASGGDYSLRSSSQFYLPESLLREEAREPPIIVDAEFSDIEEGLV
ncbi:hypothetical protein RB595_003661 [Gaeumannomyces hyphopodioides]